MKGNNTDCFQVQRLMESCLKAKEGVESVVALYHHSWHHSPISLVPSRSSYPPSRLHSPSFSGYPSYKRPIVEFAFKAGGTTFRSHALEGRTRTWPTS